MKKIIFTDVQNPQGVLDIPKPGNKHIPEWYRTAESFPMGKKIPTTDGTPYATVKRCKPVYDALTAGYIITTHTDLHITQEGGLPMYHWITDEPAIQFQPKFQIEGVPELKGEIAGTRLNHPWSIKTPRGWSVLVMQPAYRETPFNVIPGIVDTDKYRAPFNTFFTLKDPNFTGIIPAGTPYAQIIPIKRENWISKAGGPKELLEYNILIAKMKTVYFDRYRDFWWSRKSYK